MGNFFKDIGNAASKVVSWVPHTTAADKRAQNAAMAATTAQIGYYQEQKNQLVASAAADTAQKATERQRINEKQIRAKRATYRSRGSVTAAPDTSTVSDKLG